MGGGERVVKIQSSITRAESTKKRKKGGEHPVWCRFTKGRWGGGKRREEERPSKNRCSNEKENLPSNFSDVDCEINF